MCQSSVVTGLIVTIDIDSCKLQKEYLDDRDIKAEGVEMEPKKWRGRITKGMDNWKCPSDG